MSQNIQNNAKLQKRSKYNGRHSTMQNDELRRKNIQNYAKHTKVIKL